MDPIAGDGFAVDMDLQVRLADDAVGEDGTRLDRGHLLEDALELQSDLLDRFEIRALDLDPHRRTHTALQHHDTRGDGLQPRCGSGAWDLCHTHDLVPDVPWVPNLRPPLTIGTTMGIGNELSEFVAHELPVAICEAHSMALGIQDVFRLVVDHRLDHRDGGWVERRLGAAELAHDRLDLRNRLDRHVELGQDVGRLTDRCVGHRRGHVQVAALIEIGHELLAQTGESMGDRHQGTAFQHGIGHPAQHLLAAEPHETAEKDQHERDREEGDLVVQAPAQHFRVLLDEELESEQQPEDDHGQEQGVSDQSFFRAQRQPLRTEHYRHHGQHDPVRPTLDQGVDPRRNEVLHREIGPQENEDHSTPHHPLGQDEDAGDDGSGMKETPYESLAHLRIQEQMGERRHQGEGHDQRGDQGEGLGVGQRAEQLSFGGLHREHGQKAHDGGCHCGHHCSSDFG